MENSFRGSTIKTAGTDIDKLMPPVSCSNGGNREKKQDVIGKFRIIFEKYFALGITGFS